MFLVLKNQTDIQVTDLAIPLEHIKNNISLGLRDDESQNILKLIHGKYWVACDCRANNQAILTVRKSKKGVYFLVNMKNRGQHARECPLNYIPSEKILSTTKQRIVFSRNKSVDKLDTTSTFNFELKGMLNTILEQAKINQLDTQDIAITNQSKIMSVGLDKLFINKTPLSELLFLGLRGFFKARSLLRNEKNEGASYFIIDVVDEIVKETDAYVAIKYYQSRPSYSFKFFEKLTAMTIDRSTKGPYIVFACISTTDKGVIAPTQALIQPIVSKKLWLPVNNLADRITANKLIKTIRWYKEKFSFNVTAIKPLYTTNNTEPQGLPSYLIASKDRKVTFDVESSQPKTEQHAKSINHHITQKTQSGYFLPLKSQERIHELDDIVFRGCGTVFKSLKTGEPLEEIVGLEQFKSTK